jgi:phosphotriesterase-related protein
VPVVGATGYHRDAHYPDGHWVHGASVETLAQRVVADLEVGMHPEDWLDPDRPADAARAGVVKAGASYHHVTSGERRRLEAAAIGARRAGVAIVVHTEIGTAGHEILDRLEGHGVPSSRIALAHLDRNPDAELHVELAARGVVLEYDTIGRTKYHPDSVVLDLIESVVTAGYLDQVVLGLDLGRRSSFRSHGGGPGLRYLLDTFAPRLRRRLGDEAVDRILVANPARLYAVAREGA